MSTAATDEGRPEPTPGPGFWSRLFLLYFAPAEAFTSILHRPRLIEALLCLVVLNIAFTALWTRNMDPREFLKAQVEQTPRWEQVPEDRRTEILDQQLSWFSRFAWAGAFLGSPIVVLCIGGLMYFIFRFFYASEVVFAQSLSVVAHTALAIGLVQMPLTALVMKLKDDWNLDPRHALQADPSLFLDRQDTAAPLYSLASSLDLFSFWWIFLLAVGFGLATKCRTTSAAWGVIVPWGVWVLGAAALAAVF